MRKTAVFSALFLAAFVVTAGITIFTGTVDAGIPCPTPLCQLSCVLETGPLCTLPERPNYLYAVDCVCPHGNPHHWVPDYPVFKGCCMARP